MATKVGPIIGSVIFFGIAPAVVAGWIPYTISRWRMEPPFLGIWAGRGIGLILIVIGFAILVDSFARFVLEGEGTPAPRRS